MNVKQNDPLHELEKIEDIISDVLNQNSKQTNITNEKCTDLNEFIEREVETSSAQIIDETEKHILKTTEETITNKTENIFKPSLGDQDEKINEPEKILRPFFINKFPGEMHLVVENLNKVFPSRINDSFIRLRIEYFGTSMESTEFAVAKNMNPSFYIKVPLEEVNKNFKILIFVIESKNNKKIACATIEFDKQMINSMHNRLVEIKKKFTKVQSFFNFFASDLPAASTCSVYAAYLSKDELPTINAPSPYSLLTLSKWLVARKYAYDLLFSGFLNIKGDLCDSTKFLWKLRYVKWFGYTLYVFNDKTKKVVSSINITDAIINITNLHKGLVVFDMKTHVLELHTDSKENIKKLRIVLNVLFPSSSVTVKTNKY
ncbi:hypothetical protein EHP00_369 [Ecytonucleospora hepatopenaei]|uniref:Uncharacterized protein n=1 Tax=Ecytonucleospora hepatopenaei TaxID=646526 RepID=A0A1W0E994_9MICR|nr:hypothetical protein EHP00_369 [Ecytonucleospora hepatopenaei]